MSTSLMVKVGGFSFVNDTLSRISLCARVRTNATWKSISRNMEKYFSLL